MESVQAGFANGLQIIHFSVEDGFCPGIGCDPLCLWKCLPDKSHDLGKVFVNETVAVAKKDRIRHAVDLARLFHIPFHFPERFGLEFQVFVHGAEFAAIPGTSACYPDESAVRLIGRPKRRKIIGVEFAEHSVITLMEFFLFLNSIVSHFSFLEHF